MRSASLLLLAGATVAALPAAAQTSGPPVPQQHIPAQVLFELRTLERQFDMALASDCAPERCFSKGCVYGNHATVDLPRTGSLPGLPVDQGLGSVPPQEYLTEARCEFTYEKSVPTKDVNALVRRLEQRLSRGWLKVTVGKQILEPISPSLRESPTPPEPKPQAAPPPPPEPPKPAPVADQKPPEWNAGVALRELWVSLLPHFSWMIAIVLGTLATLALIWAGRRLGRETIEEKAMAAQLAANAGAATRPNAPAGAEAANGAGLNGAAPGGEAGATGDDPAWVESQQELWNRRIAQAELESDNGVIVDLLREWLKAGEFELLAKAIFVFGDRLSLAFSSDAQLAARKVEFADYLRTVDEKTLPSDAEFFRKLNQHAISSALLAQDDAEVYRSLREEFGATGVLHLLGSLPRRHGALLFALVPTDVQHDVARMMLPELRVEIADQLLVTNRASREEFAYVFDVLNAARAGNPLPPAPKPQGIEDRGREFDAAGALSVLLPRIEPEQRSELFARALERSGGTWPRWYEDILYGDMLLKLPSELRRDLLLEVDMRGLAGWSSVQHPQWQESFLNQLAPTMQNALRASMAFGSRADQLRLARRGHNELVTAVKKQVAQGKISLAEIFT
ncbi:MAG: hypothetical protein IRZ16_20960 [Myxococcaceae bacterium]|nr:hypothetical protein [Myxococcaceae bacterium]